MAETHYYIISGLGADYRGYAECQEIIDKDMNETLIHKLRF